MSVRMRHTRAHTRNRRSHHALREPRFSLCQKCGASHIRHQVCVECGEYRGKTIIDVELREQRKEQKRNKKLLAMGLDPQKEKNEGSDVKEDQKLSAEALSKK